MPIRAIYKRAGKKKKKSNIKKLTWDTTKETKIDNDDKYYVRFRASQRKLAEFKKELEINYNDNNWKELVKVWKRLDEEDKNSKC